MKRELRRRLNAYRSQIIAADSSEVPAIRSKLYKWYDLMSDADKASAKPFWDGMKNEIERGLAEVRAMLEELRKLDEEELAEAKK